MLKFISGCIFTLALVFVFENFIKNLLNYQDVDLCIKTAASIGGVATAWGVYWKWNDEKTRNLYERRLQEVYAPLVYILIKREKYRKYLESEGTKNISREKQPILQTTDKLTRREEDGTIIEIIEDYKPVVVFKKEEFLNKFTDVNKGLVSPSLLAAASEYEFMLPYETQKWNDFRKEYPLLEEEQLKILPEYNMIEEFTKKTKVVEEKFIEEIVKGYNECVDKLDLDAQKINLDAENFWEKS